MSVYSVFGVFVCVFMCPALSQPAAAAHLHRGMGKLALVRGLQCGQRGDTAEDHSIQRTHCLSHHQGCASQWCPKTGKASFYGLTAFSLFVLGYYSSVSAMALTRSIVCPSCWMVVPFLIQYFRNAFKFGTSVYLDLRMNV